MFEALPSWVDDVIHEHVANASQFLGVLRAASFQRQSGDTLGNLAGRCESNLDALRIAGEKAVQIGQADMEDDAEVAGVVALLLAESPSGQPEASQQAADLLCHGTREIREAAWWGLRMARGENIQAHLRMLLEKPKWDFASAAALDILAFHRLPVKVDLGEALGGASDNVAWLIAEAGGRMPGAWGVTHLKQFLGRHSQRIREAALRASARCGLRELLTRCREAAFNLNPAALEALGFLGVVGSPNDLPLLLRAASNAATANAGVRGLGRLGLPASVPSLLEFLDVPEMAESAAAAIERITGQKVPRGVPPEPPLGLTEDELDLWEPNAAVAVSSAHDWWRANQERFDPDKRWQSGLCVSEDPLGPVFDQLPLGIRYDVYLRQRALVPGTPDWELETWPWKQRNPGS